MPRSTFHSLVHACRAWWNNRPFPCVRRMFLLVTLYCRNRSLHDVQDGVLPTWGFGPIVMALATQSETPRLVKSRASEFH